MSSRFSKLFAQGGQELKKEFRYYFDGPRPKKILFDHLPKCGGATLTRYLCAHYPRRKTFLTDGSDPFSSVAAFKRMSQAQRYRYDLVLGHLAHELLEYADPACLKVTVLRDPIERILSHYFYAERSPGHYLHAKIVGQGMSLEAYVTENPGGELQNWYTSHFSGIAVADMEGSSEEALIKATDVLLKRYDIVGFLDEFASFIETLRSRAGLRYVCCDERVNVTRDRPAYDDIPQATIDAISAKNALDIALYERAKNKYAKTAAG